MSKIVAEDNLPNRELMREILETCGHEVIEAEDGQQALDRVKQARPDLVLLDIQMPVLDGYAVLRELRHTPCFADLKIIGPYGVCHAWRPRKGTAIGLRWVSDEAY